MLNSQGRRILGRQHWPLLAAALSVLIFPAAVAAQPATPSAQVGDVDVTASRVFMWVGKTGLGHEHGVAGVLKSGRVILGRDRDAGELVFDMTSFDADGAEARKYVGLKGETDEGTRRQVNTNMHGQAVLHTEKFPTAVFQIDSALLLQARAGDPPVRYLLSGTFTLVGVSRPLKLPCEVVAEQGRLHLRTGFLLKQTDFGIKPFSKAFGAVGVADEMKVYGEVFVTAAP